MAAPPQINLNELYSIKEKKNKNRHICFNHILELCHRRIRTVSSYGGDNTFYEIPGMIVGYPLYNIKECMDYMVNALRKNGFLVQILPPPHYYVIYLSWAKPDISKKALRDLSRPSLMGPSGHSGHSGPSGPSGPSGTSGPLKIMPPKNNPLRLF